MRENSPVPDEVVRQYLPLDVALYSVWMPGDETTAAIQSTHPNPVRTYDEIIEQDEVHEACTAFLIRAGVPVFADAKALRAYTDALERQLKQGFAPLAARGAALEAIDAGLTGETAAD